MITIVHWLKHIIIVQKLTLVVEFWTFVFPLIAIACSQLWHHVCGNVNKSSQLAGKAYEHSDYIVTMAVMHWLNNVHHGSGVLSPFDFPLIAIACQSQLWCHKGGNACARPQRWCSQTLECVWRSVWLNYFLCKSFRYSLTDLCKSPVSYVAALLEYPMSYWNSTVLKKNLFMYPLIHPSIENYRSSYRSTYSEEASVSYLSVFCDYCALIGTSHKLHLHYTGSFWTRLVVGAGGCKSTKVSTRSG